MSRPGLWVATVQAHQAQQCAAARATKRACAHDLLAVLTAAPTTWALRAQCARATWFLGACTVHTTQFCDSALFRVTVWIQFMDTVHEHC